GEVGEFARDGVLKGGEIFPSPRRVRLHRRGLERRVVVPAGIVGTVRKRYSPLEIIRRSSSPPNLDPRQSLLSCHYPRDRPCAAQPTVSPLGAPRPLPPN